VAEIGGLDPLKVQMAYTSDNTRLSTAYAWDMLIPFRPDLEMLRNTFESWPNDMAMGWPSWAFSNHDAPRIASRWAEDGQDADWAKLFGLLLLSLRGNIFIYQGEELGLLQSDVPFESLRDPEAIANWPNTLGRDGTRTPMPWEHGQENGGFSTGDPWLPVDARHIAMSADVQEADPNSTLNFFRKLIRIRKGSEALKYGDFELLEVQFGVFAFTRTTDSDTAICVFNLTAKPVAWQPPVATKVFIEACTGIHCADSEPPVSLPPFSGYIGTVTKEAG
jgi:alpha-glucosidase